VFSSSYTPRKVKGIAMKPTGTRVMWIAAALSTIAVAAPMSTAGAAMAAAGPVAGQKPALTGATYITTAPSTFVNTNNQVSSGNTVLGDQSAR
jgi:hypothetical protein